MFLTDNALGNIDKQLRFPPPVEYWCRVNIKGSGVFSTKLIKWVVSLITSTRAKCCDFTNTNIKNL